MDIKLDAFFGIVHVLVRLDVIVFDCYLLALARSQIEWLYLGIQRPLKQSFSAFFHSKQK